MAFRVVGSLLSTNPRLRSSGSFGSLSSLLTVASRPSTSVVVRTMSSSYGLSAMEGRHFLAIDELSKEELRGLLDLSFRFKEIYGDKKKKTSTSSSLLPKPLDGHSVSMIFQKRSTRTRVSTETGMALLGGHALFLGPSDIQLGVNESLRDTALVLSRFNTHILARVFGHDSVTELASHATVPVINALSDLHHPLQTLADLMALEQRFGRNGNLEGKTLAWVGDGNNVLHDLMLGASLAGMAVRVATPDGYGPDQGVMERTRALAPTEHPLFTTTDPVEAVTGADVVVTDTWISMGQEEESKRRLKDFEGYQVDAKLMSHANPGAVFLHCLPRHPEEVADEVFYSDCSLVWDEAENRMWTVMAVMAAQAGKTDGF